MGCRGKCPPPLHAPLDREATPQSCPVWFQYMYWDLEPWKDHGGITPDVIRASIPLAAMRLTVLGGRLYVEHYYRCPRSRALFTLWGVTLLLRRYPGMVPDVDILPEAGVQPWEMAKGEILNGSSLGVEKPSTASWKGHTSDGGVRQNLSACGAAPRGLFEFEPQDEVVDRDLEFSTAHLATHCTHKYKVYAEGAAWSIGLKYALACPASTLLLPAPLEFADFYSRGLIPLRHFWPVDKAPGRLCASLRAAVEYGNYHPPEGWAYCQE
eukprot:jgi/Mesen1/9036/ME000566S08455